MCDGALLQYFSPSQNSATYACVMGPCYSTLVPNGGVESELCQLFMCDGAFLQYFSPSQRCATSDMDICVFTH